MILLNHFHVFPRGIADVNNPKTGSLDEIMELLEEYGSDSKAVAFAPYYRGTKLEDIYVSKKIEPNSWLYEELKKYPRIYGFMMVNPKEKDAIDTLRQYVKLGFKGVKMSNHMFKLHYDDEAYFPFYEEAEKLGVPVFFHTGAWNALLKDGDPLSIDAIAWKFPNLKIILAHLGGYAFFHQTWAMLQSHQNVYAELCRSIGKDHYFYVPEREILELIGHFGSERIIYGTEFPWPLGGIKEDVREDVRTIRSWPISDKDKENILGETLRKILNV